MNAKAVVVPVEDFEAWYFGEEDDIPARFRKPASPAPAPAPESALELLNRKSCTECHSVDGSPMVGPTLKGIYGREGTVLDQDGRERAVMIDEDYVRRAILDPAAEITSGYPPAMPETVMTDDELRRMVDYIRNLR
jgi:cytochrome c oxidase subunit 2